MTGIGRRAAIAAWAFAAAMAASCADSGAGEYPWHTDIVATTFWVGEIFDATATDGSQVISAYDSAWQEHYGGCDGVEVAGRCETEPRGEHNGFFPSSMTPLENPFYLDLPYDDIGDDQAFARRGEVVPWADEPPYADRVEDRTFSFLKNRWVEIVHGSRVCYGQIQDAGPGEYHDEDYVFGADDTRPANRRYNGAGMDVSPALNGCLGFTDPNGTRDRVNWRFVNEHDVPNGPWNAIVTTRGVG